MHCPKAIMLVENPICSLVAAVGLGSQNFLVTHRLSQMNPTTANMLGIQHCTRISLPGLIEGEVLGYSRCIHCSFR
jgi:hypothetical protein